RFQNCRDNQPRPGRVVWTRLAELLTAHAEREEKDGPLWSPTKYAQGATRKAANVLAVSCLVADLDEGGADVSAIDRAFAPWFFAVHSTHSFTAKHPKFRLVVPLADDVSATDWPEVWKRWAWWMGLIGQPIDKACKDPSRIYYLPSCPPGGERLAYANDTGELLPVDRLPNYPKRERLKITPAIDLPRQEGRVESATLIDRAAHQAHDGNRNAMGLWLACQMRDNGYGESDAEAALRDYHARAPGGQDEYQWEECLGSLQQAYSSPAREPWKVSHPRTPEEAAYGIS
ncbi:MAG: hypothetical protein ABFE08_19880, partial [Armatimonadia bacterium]